MPPASPSHPDDSRLRDASRWWAADEFAQERDAFDLGRLRKQLVSTEGDRRTFLHVVALEKEGAELRERMQEQPCVCVSRLLQDRDGAPERTFGVELPVEVHLRSTEQRQRDRGLAVIGPTLAFSA
jgi:hypothetical protein